MNTLTWKHLILTAALFSMAPVAAVADANEVFRHLWMEPGNPVFQEDLKRLLPSITDTNELQLALAVHVLGRLRNEDMAGAQTARDALAKRFPGNPYLDTLTLSKLGTACHRCNGDGSAKVERCDRCSGTRRCVACAGKGRLWTTKDHSSVCPDCSGNGHCRICNGSGRTEGDCGVCKGRGVVLDMRKISQSVRGLLVRYRGRDGMPESDDPK